MCKSSTNTSSSSAYPQYEGAYNSLLGTTENLASRPYQQYQGELLAPLTGQQNQAFGISGQGNVASPYINTAQNYFGNATTPLWGGVQQFSPQTISNYESPYTSSVVNATTAEMQNVDQQQQQALNSGAIGEGAFGGDRSGVASANLANQQNLALGQTIGGLEQQGYQTGLGEFNTQQQAQLGANEANAWLNSQAGFGTASLGQELEGTNTAAMSNLLNTGGLQQQQAQEALNIPYEQFLQQEAWPYQQASWAGGLETGLGSAAGGTQTTQGPSALSQGLGTLFGGIGALGTTGAFSSAAGSSPGWLSAALFANRGGAVPHRQGGGTTSGMFQPIAISDAVPNPDVSIFPTASPTTPLPRINSAGSGQNTAQNSQQLGQSGGAALGTVFGGTGYPASNILNQVPLTDISANTIEQGFVQPDMPSGDEGIIPIGPYAFGGPVKHFDTGGADLEPDDPSGLLGAASPVSAPANDTGPAFGGGPGGGPAFGGASNIVPFRSNYTPPKADYTQANAMSARAPWEALLAAGLGMMAGRSPHAAENIGAGGLEGLKTYEGLTNQANTEREKQQGVENEGAYRAATLQDDVDKISEARDEAQAKIKQEGDALAWQREHGTQQLAIDTGLLAVKQGELGVLQGGTWEPKGVDPKTNLPIMVNSRTGEEKIGSMPMAGPKQYGSPVEIEVPDKDGNTKQILAQQDQATGQWVTGDEKREPIDASTMRIVKGGEQGGRESVLLQRGITAAHDAISDIENLSQMPITVSGGPFAGRKQGPTLFDATKEALTNSYLTPDEVQAYQATTPGLGRALAILSTGGVGVNEQLEQSFNQLQLKEGDSQLTKLQKLATYRQNVENAITGALDNPRLGQKQIKDLNELDQRVQSAIPWTVADVNRVRFSNDPNQTIRQAWTNRGQNDNQSGTPPPSVNSSNTPTGASHYSPSTKTWWSQDQNGKWQQIPQLQKAQ